MQLAALCARWTAAEAAYDATVQTYRNAERALASRKTVANRKALEAASAAMDPALALVIATRDALEAGRLQAQRRTTRREHAARAAFHGRQLTLAL